uniref:Uncharacterized protein n=1 Tax=Oryza nivara TaxID=4536 RepID=A0A0E0GZQ2_ORYNI
MWFCHRRLKDRKPPSKRQQLEEEVPVPVMAPPPVLPPQGPHSELTMGTGGMYGEQLLPSSSHGGTGRPSAIPKISTSEVARRYFEPPQLIDCIPHQGKAWQIVQLDALDERDLVKP